MKLVTYNELIELSYSNEYRKYLDFNFAYLQHLLDGESVEVLMEQQQSFPEFLEENGYKLAI